MPSYSREKDRGDRGGDRERQRYHQHSHHYREDYHRRDRSRSRSGSQSRRKNHYERDEREYRYRGRKSRSRSKERRNNNDAFYQERGIEEMEQKIRHAIRNHNIQFDPELHEAYTKLPESKQEELADQAQSIEKIHECVLVRELFISGLSEMTQGSIKQIMGKYGEIEAIEILKNFAFVKYYKVQDASNACADYHSINTTLHPVHNSNFKIFFADHLKRWNVVSNHPNYEIREMLIPVVYASVKNDPQFVNDHYLHHLFSKFGFVRNLEIRKNELPGPKIYVTVQYETIAQAFRARDRLRYQKDSLGDRRSEVTLLIDTDKLTRLNPNVNNQLRYQRKRQQSAATFTTMTSQVPMMPNSFPNAPEMKPPENANTEELMTIIRRAYGDEDHEVEHEEQSDWVGFLTRNKQMKVEVDFNRIHKEVPFELESIINMSHRADILQGLNHNDYVLAGKFKAANKLNVESFNEYIRYLRKKNRAGIIYSKQYLIYMVPYIEGLNLPYQVDPQELLALFYKIPDF